MAVLTCLADGTAVIGDLRVKERNVARARLLICMAARRALAERRDEIKFARIDAGLCYAALRGFRRQAAYGLVLSVHAIDLLEVEDMLQLRDNWTVTLGDSDVF